MKKNIFAGLSATATAAQAQMEQDRVRLEAERQQREMERAYRDLQGQLGRTINQGLGQYQPQMGGGANCMPGTPQYQPTPSQKRNREEAEKRDYVFRKEVTIAEAKRLLIPLLSTPIVPFLWGPPGVGKSEIVKSICLEQGWELIDLRLSLLNPVDLRGLPVVNKEDRRADWYHPSFLPNGHNKKKGILFLDEINLAPLSVQAAAYQLILDKQIGDYRFPKEWMMIAAGNRTEDRANVYKISAPLANRFAHFTIVPDFATWREWAVGKVRSEIIDFLIVRPALLFQMPREGDQAFPTPRSWTFLSSLLTAYGLDEGVSEDVKHVVIGTIGDSVGEEFMTHLETYDLKGIAEKIDKFVATGKISLPSDATATRFAIIQAILDAHLSGKVNDDRFKTFKKKLSGEEVATVEAEIKKRLVGYEDHDVPENIDGVEVPF